MKKRFHPGFHLSWTRYPHYFPLNPPPLNFYSCWKWQQPTRYGFTIRIGWMLLMFGQAEKGQPFLDD